MRPLLIALQLLTRLPVRLNGAPEPGELGRSVLFYPLVGLLLGSLLAALAWLLAPLPTLLAAALLLVAWVGLTGALHLDGLADSCDAWAGGRGDRERTLTIMKDPRSGPMGVTAVVLVLLVKFAALCALIEAGEYLALLFVPLLARTALPLLFLTTPYVRPGGLGSALAAELPRKMATGAVLLSFAIVALGGGAHGRWAVLGALAAFGYLRTAMHRRIGGTTGDTAGALVELTETVVLIGIVGGLSLRMTGTTG